MVPTKVRPVERHEDAIARRLIVVGPDPVEAAVNRDVPWIAEAAGDYLQIVSAVIASQHTAIQAPVIRRMMICAAVIAFARLHRSGEIRDVGGRGESPQIAKWLRSVAARFVEPLRVPLAHVKLAVRGPIQSMQSVLQIAEIGVDLKVLVGLVVAVPIAHDREVRGIRNP